MRGGERGRCRSRRRAARCPPAAPEGWEGPEPRLPPGSPRAPPGLPPDSPRAQRCAPRRGSCGALRARGVLCPQRRLPNTASKLGLRILRVFLVVGLGWVGWLLFMPPAQAAVINQRERVRGKRDRPRCPRAHLVPPHPTPDPNPLPGKTPALPPPALPGSLPCLWQRRRTPVTRSNWCLGT